MVKIELKMRCITQKKNKMSTKTCEICKTDKSLDSYYKYSSGKLHKMCKQCNLQKQRDQRAKRKRELVTFQKCEKCEKSKKVSQYFEVTGNYHKTCKNCCKGIEHLCIKCNKILTIDQFWVKNKTNDQTPRNHCKSCVTNDRDRWRNDNPERYRKQVDDYLAKPETKEIKRQNAIEYMKNPVNRKKRNDSEKLRCKNDPGYRARKSLKSRINLALKQKGIPKLKTTMNLIGCSMEHFKTWMTYQFTSEITWENYGSYWHIDHIKPCASFDLSKPEEQKICFHWSNLQPLEKIANIKKGDKYNFEIKFKGELMLTSFKIQNKID